MSTPLEVVAAPFEVWIGPVGEAFPLIGAAPAGNWVKIGTSGALNYTEDGVTVTHEQTIEMVRSLGDTGPIKAFRTEETLRIGFTLMDITLENYKYALNFGTVTDNAPGSGIAGFRSIDLHAGLDVDDRALLVRGLNASPYLANTNVQYQIPVAFENASPAIVYQKGVPAGLELEWIAKVDAAAASASKRFGTLIMQDEAAI